MFAVIKTGGKQYKVQKGDVLEVEKLDAEEGKKVTFDKVLLVEDNGNTLVGTPHVDKAQVLAVVLESIKGEKVIVFKKKRRKQYKKKSGHRQEIMRIKIEEIFFGDKAPSPKKPAPPEEKKVAPKPKPEAEPKAEKTVKKKEPAAPKKDQTAKPAAKKAAKKVSATKADAVKKTAKPKDKEPTKPKKTKTETKPKPKVKAKTTTKE